MPFSTPGVYSPYQPGYVPPRAPDSRAEDQGSLGKVQLAAILGLVGALLSVIELFATPASSFIGVTTVGSGSSVSIDLSGLYFTVVFGIVGFVFLVLELVLYRQAFRTLSPVDPRFSTPSRLVMVLLIGLLIVILAGIAIFGVIYQAVQCAGPGNPITTACLNLGSVLGLLLLLVAAGIAAFVGFIGLLIGIWRLGTRYDEGLFKVGAILLIFPLLNIVGQILILLAARAAREPAGIAVPPATFG